MDLFAIQICSHNSYVRTSISVLYSQLSRPISCSTLSCCLCFSLFLIFFCFQLQTNECSLDLLHAWAVEYSHLVTFYTATLFDPSDLMHTMKFQSFYHDKLSYTLELFYIFFSIINCSLNFSTSMCGIVELKWHRIMSCWKFQLETSCQVPKPYSYLHKIFVIIIASWYERAWAWDGCQWNRHVKG